MSTIVSHSRREKVWHSYRPFPQNQPPFPTATASVRHPRRSVAVAWTSEQSIHQISTIRMEASSLHSDYDTTSGGVRQNMQEYMHETTYPTPRAQPVNIVIPSELPSPHDDHVLKVVQQPEIAKVAAPREKGKSMSMRLCHVSLTKYHFICSSNAT